MSKKTVNSKKVYMDICYMDFNDQYHILEKEYPGIRLELSQIPGTNCYCDDEAKKTIRKQMEQVPMECRVHFLDSGNYHYLTLLWLERIREPFSLVMMDHHPDYKEAAFGGITSCGGWVREALETFPNLKRVYLGGVDSELIQQLQPLSHRITLFDIHTPLTELIEPQEGPFYISLDKDVMGEEYARTDWTQGAVTLQEVMGRLEEIYTQKKVLGVDICGEKKENPSVEDKTINEATNRVLLHQLLEKKIIGKGK